MALQYFPSSHWATEKRYLLGRNLALNFNSYCWATVSSSVQGTSNKHQSRVLLAAPRSEETTYVMNSVPTGAHQVLLNNQWLVLPVLGIYALTQLLVVLQFGANITFIIVYTVLLVHCFLTYKYKIAISWMLTNKYGNYNSKNINN